MSDSYYELIDATNELGEKFIATDMVRSTWSAAIQHAAPGRDDRLGVGGVARMRLWDDLLDDGGFGWHGRTIAAPGK